MSNYKTHSNQAKDDSYLAKLIIAKVLEHLNIERVIYVDDYFEAVVNKETAGVIGWLVEANSHASTQVTSLLSDISLLSEIDLSDPDEVWQTRFNQLWPELTSNEREQFITRLSELLPNAYKEDRLFVSSISGFFDDIIVEQMGPSEWERRRDVLLTDEMYARPLLCLFDQDLRLAPGYTSSGPRSGEGLLADTVKRFSGRAVCGIFSYRFTQEEEISQWRKIADENNIDLEAFLPISKNRVTTPLAFADGVQKASLNMYCERLKKHAKRVIEAAYPRACDRLESMDVYDFDHIVLRMSRKEGCPEVEAVLRLFNIFQQDNMKMRLLEAPAIQEFYAAVEQARILSSVFDDLAKEFGRKSLVLDRIGQNQVGQRWELRRQELYENEELVNRFHLPLETGDLFQLEADNEPRFILLAQPCDLMVRFDGLRGSSGHDKVAALVPIQRKTQESFSKEFKKGKAPGKGMLKYLYADSNDIGLVIFGQAHIVRLELLDLAVLDYEGCCRLNVDTHLHGPPPQWHHPWRERWSYILKKYQHIADTLDSIIEAIDMVHEGRREEAIRAIMPKMSLSSFGLKEMCYEKRAFNFGIRRVGRLREPRASQLLTEYTSWQARTADLPDFGEDI